MSVEPLATVDTLLEFVGREDADQDTVSRAETCITLVSAMIRAYTAQTITLVTGDTAVLTGNHSRRLNLGERPVRAVVSVVFDGTMLDPKSYRWTRNGTLWRDPGWGGPEYEIVITYDHGYPELPPDVEMVAVLAGARLFGNPSAVERVAVEDFSATYAVPAGFTIAEQLILNRYRARING